MQNGKMKKICAISVASLQITTAPLAHSIDDNEGMLCQLPAWCSDYCCYGNWFAEIDILDWRTSGCGLGFATETTFTRNRRGEEIEETKVYNPKFRWDTGIRAGLGFDFFCGWDLGAYWTHLHTRASRRLTAGPFAVSGKLIAPIYGTDLGLSDPELPLALAPSDIGAKWRYQLDLLDVDIGHEFATGCCVTLRPFVGIRGAWTKQKYHIVVTGPTGTPGVRNFDNLFLESEFEGGGLRTGFDSESYLGCGFSLYSKAAINVLYGSGRSRIKERKVIVLNLDNPIIDTENSTQRDHWQGCRAITDLALGLRYRQFFCCDTVSLTLSVGWENHLFFNDNRFENFARLSGKPLETIESTDRNFQHTKGDICFEGWTFAGRVEF